MSTEEAAVKEDGPATASTSEKAPTPVADGDATKEGMEWDGSRWVVRSEGRSLVFDEEKKEWVTAAEAADSAEIGGLWVHRDPTSGLVSVFDADNKAWTPLKDEPEEEETAEAAEAAEDDELAFQLAQTALERRRLKERKLAAQAKGHAVYVCPKDGVVWEWTPAAGWAPEVDDDFLARYQASYGNYRPPTPDPEAEAKAAEEKAAAAKAEEEKKNLKRKKKEPEWFDQESETASNVYVTGLPKDTTPEAFAELMAKCGVLCMDIKTRKPKVKLYRDADGSLKGDGLCTYFKKESVQLALKLIDGSRMGENTLSVSVAKFQLKGEFDPVLAKKNKLTKAQKKDLQERQAQLAYIMALAWVPEKLRGERAKSEAVIVLKGLFQPQEFLDSPELLLEVEEELKAECGRLGALVKVTVFGTNPEGVAMVKYASPQVADDALTMLDYRLIRQRQIRAERWDGETKYNVKESAEARKKREAQWAEYLAE